MTISSTKQDVSLNNTEIYLIKKKLKEIFPNRVVIFLIIMQYNKFKYIVFIIHRYYVSVYSLDTIQYRYYSV